MAQNQEAKPEPTQGRPLSFWQRWLRLVDEGVARRLQDQERRGVPILPAAHSSIFFQAGLIALWETIAQRRKHKAKEPPKPTEEEATQ